MTIKAVTETKEGRTAMDLSVDQAAAETETCHPPTRAHSRRYHRPLLLDNRDICTDFLAWFDRTCEQRQMPWRKPWLSLAKFKGSEDEFQVVQARRAYEIWVSEIMLQQTRVSTVIPYFNNWISKWPTVEDLAAANQDEVLALWKGLGYYSRATRLHEAAQQIHKDMAGILPSDVKQLLQIKGIGRYTAGAVSSIAFGRAVPLLDGNVARVLCRQLGLHSRVKEKRIDEMLWDTADALVKHVAQHEHDDYSSDVPSRWNQALMELGSTVCTPTPKCEGCPIRSTCRSFSEGQLLGRIDTDGYGAQRKTDIEDACTLCEPLQLEDVEDAAEEVLIEREIGGRLNGKTKKRARSVTALNTRPEKTVRSSKSKQRSLRDFAAFASSDRAVATEAPPPIVREDYAQIRGYCSTFPKREPKKTVPEEECIVCIIRWKDNTEDKYLIEQRPPKGLLASLWEFPTCTIPTKTELKANERKAASEAFVRKFLNDHVHIELGDPVETGMVTHVFSHLKLHMHVHVFLLQCQDETATRLVSQDLPRRAWVDHNGVQNATLGTGVRRCWEKYCEKIGIGLR